jgi:glycosyltransferase involved in cell wall biosynthesis
VIVKVLLIAFEFPPLNSGGAHRPYRQARELGKHGIRPYVVTTEVTAHEGGRPDPSMGTHQGNGYDVVRTPIDPQKPWQRFHDRYYFNVVDTAASRWRKHLIHATDRLVKEHRFQAIQVTAPPFSMAGLGVELARRYHLPLVLDLRDAWSNWVVAPYASRLHHALVLRKERKALLASTAVVTTSAQTMEDLMALHPMVPRERFHLVTNGYEGDPPRSDDTITIGAPTPTKPLLIGYVGSFYFEPYQRSLMFSPWWRKLPHQYLQYSPHKEDWLYRSPHFFLKALAGLVQRRPEASKLLKVAFVGKVPGWLPPMVRSFGLENMVELRGPMPHAGTLAFQRQCDLLLLTSAKVIGGRDFSIAGKTFEYVGSGKPVLAFTCDGAQHDLLCTTGLMVHCPPDDEEASIAQLERLLEGTVMLHPNREVISDLSVSNTTARLAAVLRGSAGRIGTSI